MLPAASTTLASKTAAFGNYFGVKDRQKVVQAVIGSGHWLVLAQKKKKRVSKLIPLKEWGGAGKKTCGSEAPKNVLACKCGSHSFSPLHLLAILTSSRSFFFPSLLTLFIWFLLLSTTWTPLSSQFLIDTTQPKLQRVYLQADLGLFPWLSL